MFNAIILDESHKIKNEDSKRTEAVLPLCKAAKRCVLVSGTPAFSRPKELWTQLEAVGNVWCSKEEYMERYVYSKGSTEKDEDERYVHVMSSSFSAFVLCTTQPTMNSTDLPILTTC